MRELRMVRLESVSETISSSLKYISYYLQMLWLPCFITDVENVFVQMAGRVQTLKF